MAEYAVSAMPCSTAARAQHSSGSIIAVQSNGSHLIGATWGKTWLHLGASDALQVAEADVVLQGGDVKAIERCARHSLLGLQRIHRTLLLGTQQRSATACQLDDNGRLPEMCYSWQCGMRGLPLPPDWHICKSTAAGLGFS